MMISQGRLPLKRDNELTPLVSVAVAVFRNSLSLRMLYSEITDVARRRFPELNLEIVFVDDGSDDDSWDLIQELRREDPSRVSAHKLTRNFGQLSAMVAAFELSRGDAVVSISADLQDPTEIIGDMVERWLSGDDVVIANRVGRSDGKLSAFASRIAYRYARGAYRDIPDGGFDYFLMSRRVADKVLEFKGRFRFLQGDLLWLGFPTSLIPYERKKRPHGKSGYSLRRRFKSFTELVIDASYKPIQIMSMVGYLVAALGALYSIDIFIAWVWGETPFEGWAPLMVVTLVLSGLILVMLGIVGAYIWRIYDHIRQRPMSVLLHSEFSEPPDDQHFEEKH
jgi:glycosyltransferase involved in cell wall biosynthesis